MKIHLILSASKNYRDAVTAKKQYRTYAPVTLIQLAALVPPELEAEVKLTDLMGEPLPAELDADLIGISTLTCGAPGAYRIADRARARGITVVMGGSHPTLCPDEALDHADAVVVGYGEKTWPRLLRDYKNNRLQRVYRDFSNPYSSPLPEINRKLLPRSQYLFRNCIETTRGCPNHCSFCVIGDLTAGRYWKRNIREVVAEIEKTGRELLFVDSSPMESRAYAMKLWREMTPLKVRWFSGATTRFGEDEEAVRLAVKSGCRGVLMGFESLSQKSVNETEKGFNKVEHYSRIINRLHDHGIGVLGAFIFGFDGDDPSVFERTVEFADKMKIDILKYAILTPLPGTAVFRELKKQGRILTEDWNAYDTEHVAFRPAGMSPEQLEEGCKWAHRQTYSYSSILRRVQCINASWLYSVLGNLGFRRVAKRYYSQPVILPVGGKL